MLLLIIFIKNYITLDNLKPIFVYGLKYDLNIINLQNE